MANDNLKTKLGSAGKGTFQSMMKDGFGIVTVMNAYICDAIATEDLKNLSFFHHPYAFVHIHQVFPSIQKYQTQSRSPIRL